MKISECVQEEITFVKEVDYYTPVSVKFSENDEKDKELFYYRFFNSVSSFVEISVNSETKKITDITLVSINDIMDMSSEKYELINALKYINANPIIDCTDILEKNMCTQNIEFRIYRFDKKIIALDESNVICTAINMGDVDLLLDINQNIVGFIFKNFNEMEWSELSESIESSTNLNNENK